MDRTQAYGNVLVGGKRRHRNADLAAGVDGSDLDANDSNAIQEEILGVIEATGIVPDGANWAQLDQAIRRYARANVTGLGANTALTPDHAGLLYLSATAGNRVFTLPPAAAAGARRIWFDFIRSDFTANSLTIQTTTSGDTIEGATAFNMPIGSRITLYSDGASVWRVFVTRGFNQVLTLAGAGGTAGASGTVTVPAWAMQATLTGTGGGAGAGGSVANSAGGGGGSGAFVEATIPVQPGATITYVVGTGGNAGGVGADGTDGADTYFSINTGPVTGTILIAGGGKKGKGGTGTAVVGAGGAPGSPTGGSLALNGMRGDPGDVRAGDYRGGRGAGAPMAGGGAGPGENGGVFGSGGGGGWNNAVAPGFGAGGLGRLKFE